jgi:hypothetical protein
MIRAGGRLLGILIFVLLWGAAAIYGIRKIGLNERFSPLTHSAFTQSPWIIATPNPTQKNIDHVYGLGANFIFGSKVQRTSDHIWVLSNATFVELDGVPKRIHQIDFKTWGQLHPNELNLESVLKQYKEKFIYLDTRLIPPLQFSEFLKFIRDEKITGLLLNAQNRQNKLLAKKLEPFWLFEATTSELAAIKFLSSLYLESVSSQDADFYITDKYNVRIASEARRRQRRYLLKLDLPPDHFDFSSVDGIITAQPDMWVHAVETGIKKQ